MRKRIPAAALARVLVMAAGLIRSTTLKPAKDVSLDELTRQTQLSVEPSDGMNLTWFS